MEQENIKYTGITQATTDLDCPDGDLSVSHNIINYNGAMRPVILPEPEFTLKSGETLLYIHTTSAYKNFIYQTGNSIKAFTFTGNSRKDYTISYTLSDGEVFNKIESVGNTLILLTTKGMYYWLFKELDYTPLGNKIPEIPINFGLITTPVLYSDTESPHNQKYWAFTVTFDAILSTEKYNEFSENNKEQITNQVMAAVNKFINNNTIEKGQFMYPFFVRYAYRMYDGSLILHSAPVLMNPSSGTNPLVICQLYGNDGVDRSFKADLFSSPCKLDYSVTATQNEIDDFKRWKDIIKSIDIFISQPIYTFNPNGKCQAFQTSLNFSDYLIAKISNNSMIGKDAALYKHYQKWEMAKLFNLYTNITEKEIDVILPLPEIDRDEFYDKIRECSNFYFVDSINISQLSSDRKNVNISSDKLKNLAQKELMTDDYQSHDVLAPEYSFVYNNRLNIANISRELFNGFDTSALGCANTGTIQADYSGNVTGEIGSYNRLCYIFINEGGKEIVVKNTHIGTIRAIPAYMFYPNKNAYKAVFSPMTSGGDYTFINLIEHKNLNGAYFFSEFEGKAMFHSQPTVSIDRIISIPNKLYTSEVGNPFFFPLEGINTIGVGKILGMTSTTRALSQGQFGQFPLLVFATDGIWAMEVSGNGLYSVKQPISRDICSNPKSITQIDGAAVFISDKGAMIINASEVNTFSAELDGPAFLPESIIKFDTIAEKEDLTKEVTSFTPVKDFLTNCQIAYDYPNSRLLFINADKPYAYMYSLESHSWATVTSSFTHVVSDYPYTYLQNKTQGIVNISSKMDYESDKRAKSIMLSRPIKLGDDMLKTINQIINRGNFEKDKINVVLFASADGITYFPIGSAKGPQISGLCGSPYKYFRIAIISNFSMKESLSATSVYFTPKWRNKPR